MRLTKLSAIKQHTCAGLEAGTGGPQQDIGRTMRDAHRGVNVSPTEYMAVLDAILAALRKHGIDEQTQKDAGDLVFAEGRDRPRLIASYPRNRTDSRFSE